MSIISILPNTATNAQPQDALQIMADLNRIRDDVNNNTALKGANTDITALGGLTTMLAAVNLNRTINAQTGTTYTFVITDGNQVGGNPLVTFSNTSPVTATIPNSSTVPFPLGTQIDCIQDGAGKVTFAAAGGVTINAYGAYQSITNRYCAVSLILEAPNVWYLVGSLTTDLLPPILNYAIFGYGFSGAAVSMTNLVSNAGVVSTDTTGVGTARYYLAAAGYGTDKSIFGYGKNNGGVAVSMTNLVSNLGVVSTDTTGVGTSRSSLAAAGYGTDKSIFGYGLTTVNVSMTNLVSNLGVVAIDTTGVGTARQGIAATTYGTDKAIFGYGNTGGSLSMTNLVSNTGVVATDTTGVGTARGYLAAAGYGTDKSIFGYGYTTTYVSMTNLVSNAGVVATDTTGVGTARYLLAATTYGTDKAIFGYGNTGAAVSMTNLVSNAGVLATDTTGVGTARYGLAAASYG